MRSLRLIETKDGYLQVDPKPSEDKLRAYSYYRDQYYAAPINALVECERSPNVYSSTIHSLMSFFRL